jgi:hypothetical protein
MPARRARQDVERLRQAPVVDPFPEARQTGVQLGRGPGALSATRRPNSRVSAVRCAASWSAGRATLDLKRPSKSPEGCRRLARHIGRFPGFGKFADNAFPGMTDRASWLSRTIAPPSPADGLSRRWVQPKALRALASQGAVAASACAPRGKRRRLRRPATHYRVERRLSPVGAVRSGRSMPERLAAETSSRHQGTQEGTAKWRCANWRPIASPSIRRMIRCRCLWNFCPRCFTADS